MAGPSYQLVMRTGPTPGKIFPVEKNEIFIGRDLGNDVVISDAEISRRHARLVMQAGGFVLEDLGSTNGTVVNGQRLMGPYLLRPGEVITLGEHVTLTFDSVVFDPDATVASGAAHGTLPASQQPAISQVPPPAQAVPEQAHYVPPSPIPSFAGEVPPGPAMEPAEPVKRNITPIIIAIIVVLVLIIGACAGILLFIDANRLWCSLPFHLIPGCP
jgi:hypothetical protein